MSRPITEEEAEELLKKFEEIISDSDDDDELEMEDFGYYNAIKYPKNSELEYPVDEPPPIPKEAACKHNKKKKVIISHSLKYWYCPDCKKDLGDVK